ncbi:hypothetical protein OPQ81_009124 [Rhizoctonia solani]|nr:hypothetical protein OPQ81_009124 [Rhizoctonia solani]
MYRMPTLEYSLSHPHPKGHWFLLATIIIFGLSLPILIILNLVTLGSELVPSLQTNFQPNDELLEGWWGTHRLPRQLRPRAPVCQPKDLGRGDSFRLSASLFDYTVMSSWNTSQGPREDGVQEQQRVEYRGQSFAHCSVNTARFDYSMVDQTQSVHLGVTCNGTKEYPVYVSMQTTMTFAWEISMDFIGQYYGPNLELLNINNTNPSDYRKVVLGALQVISTDSISIMRKPHLPTPAVSMRISWAVDPFTGEIGESEASTLTYVNGTQPDPYPEDAINIYGFSIYNLVTVAIDSVNLDLGNNVPTIFQNASRLKTFISPNLPPDGINSTNWVNWTQSFYYGTLPSPYQTWAQMLLDGKPVALPSNLTGRPRESVMATTYLCPAYRVKPTGALLASVFVGSATMTLSVWTAWMFFTTFLAKRIMAPRVICHCGDCEKRRAREAEEARIRAATPASSGIFARFMERIGFRRRGGSASNHGDPEIRRVDPAPWNMTGRHIRGGQHNL